MRVRRLNLIRYGRFTDAEIDLPDGGPDLHIIVGPNEAGKSTARAALSDLLFGIPSRSALNFLHDYGNMRIGAVLESNGERIDFRRRKGNRDTLLNSDDTRMTAGEQALLPFLGGIDRGFFERMFSLDHERLRRGGRELLDGKSGDAGQQLFSAGSGIQDLRTRLSDLDDQANQLWTKRRAGHRTYYIAADKLKEAEDERRDCTVSADNWRRLRQAYEDAKRVHGRLQGEIQEAEIELRKISRIRRVAPHVSLKSRRDAEINALGEVADIPGDSVTRLQNAEQERLRGQLRSDECRTALDEAREKRSAIKWDDSLLLHESDIEALHQLRIQVNKELADLPRLKAKLESEEAGLRRMAGNLGWDAADAKARAEQIPRRQLTEQARALLSSWSERAALVDSTRASRTEADTRQESIKRDLDAAGSPLDVRSLAALISATKSESGGIGPQIAAAESEAGAAKADVERLFAGLDPKPPSGNTDIGPALPTPSEAQQHRDRRRELDQRLRAREERLWVDQQKVARGRADRRRLIAEGQPVSPEDVSKARQTRDSLWSAIRSRFIDGEGRTASDRLFDGATPQSAASQYEGAVGHADQLGDQRVETAEATARLAEVDKALAAGETSIADIETELGRFKKESDELDTEWNRLWKAASIVPHGPDRMLGWLATHDELRAARVRFDKAGRRVADLRSQEAEAALHVLAELSALGTVPVQLEGQRLAVILEYAAELQQRQEREAESRGRLEHELSKAASETKAKRKALDQAETAAGGLRAEWSDIAVQLGIDAKASQQTAGGQIGEIDAMREVARKIADLRNDRVDKIERDIDRFGQQVKTVVQVVATDLQQRDSRDAAAELERRLARNKQGRSDAEKHDAEIESLSRRIKALEGEIRSADETITLLQNQAGVDTVEALKAEIKKVETHRELSAARSSAIEAIGQGGDGLGIDALEAECAGVDVDEIALSEEALTESTEKLRAESLKARDTLIARRDAFESVGGSDAAATAEGARQSALAEMQEIAEQYIQTRTATSLLRWAIERYRTDKQGPMLKRAGQLFSDLTLGSFDHLDLDFDDQDQARLMGCRKSGERVATSGMSDGSADQLYLALRVAALEDYLEHSPQMPFIADDLFINFDDRRASAGLQVLGKLARRCQVIFFTHHEHLVELATQSLQDPAQVRRIGQ